MKFLKYKKSVLGAFCLFAIATGCKKFVDVDAPITSTSSENVFKTDATAISAVTSIYADMSAANMITNNLTSFTLFGGLSADEFTLFDRSNTNYNSYYSNTLSAASVGNDFWTTVYPVVYAANAAIEGVSASASLTTSVKQQLIGEAKFIRAFCYFHLVNLYGDVPVALSIDYKTNAQLGRSNKADVYSQIVTDLTEAQNLLSSNFLDASLLNSTLERVRPTKWAALALLSKVYLFTGDYVKAESVASQILVNSSQFALTSLNNVFLKNSVESIWQLQPVNAGQNTKYGIMFVLPATGPTSSANPVTISSYLLNSFENGDMRRSAWVNTVTPASTTTTTYYYPYKYKQTTTTTSASEYLTVFRLAEIYLIRAEARAQLNRIAEAVADLNVVRARSRQAPTLAIPNPLPDIPNTISQAQLLQAILNERKIELFAEWGNRWLDLKRSNLANSVMPAITNSKGGTWETTDQLYPISQTEIQKSSLLTQNPGY